MRRDVRRMTLRPYQSACITAVEEGFKTFSKQLIVVPTGGGKTLIFSNLAMRNAGRTLILCHREELITQAIDKLYASTGIKAGKEKAEARANATEKVVVGAIQSLVRESRLHRWPA